MAEIRFDIIDKNTIDRLTTKDVDLLPKAIDVPKAEQWNKKQIQRQITEGITKGEAIPKIAKRFETVIGMTTKQSVRNARTAITNAENAGRLDRMNEAKAMGIKVQKEWIATNDSRTRDSHASINGEIVDIDKKFSNDCDAPGDYSADPSEVYNCRCTLGYVLPDLENDVMSIEENPQEFMSTDETIELNQLLSKYPNKEALMLFGDAKEFERYDYLVQKAKRTAGEFDYEKLFTTQSVTENKLNSWHTIPTKIQKDALGSYVRSGYIDINSYLRYGGYARDKVKNEAKAIQSFLEDAITKEDIYLKRGITKPAITKMLGEDVLENPQKFVGTLFEDKGFVSTTPYMSGGFGGDAIMYIKAPKGTKGAYIQNYAAAKTEKEFLLQSNTKFAVKNIIVDVDKWGDKKYKIFCEVLV